MSAPHRKVVLAGGSGQVGGILSRALEREGVEVVVLSRAAAATGAGEAPAGAASGAGARAQPARSPRSPRAVHWDGSAVGPWAAELEGAQAVVNLAGRSVDCRYGPANRRAILDSRVRSTRAIGEAIQRSARPPEVWLQASTATIYAHRFDAPNDEATGVIGGGEPGAPDTWRFSVEVARAWEGAVDEHPTPRTRKVKLRSAMTMSPDPGGVFDVLLRLVRARLGGRAGDGRQYVSWIHDEDFARAVLWLIERPDLEGAVNLAAPEPLPNADFMRALREAAEVRLGLPASRWMLEVGAFLLRTESELVLKSRRVVPGRLLASGFEFRFPTWPEAARDLVTRWRALRAGAA